MNNKINKRRRKKQIKSAKNAVQSAYRLDHIVKLNQGTSGAHMKKKKKQEEE